MSQRSGITLPGSPVDTQPLRHCDKCDVDKSQQGGVQMGSKWFCVGCWVRLNARRK